MIRTRFAFSLRQTLILGAALGILIPAMVFTIAQISTKFDSEIALRVHAPMRQYADMLSSGAGIAIWNIDQPLASELVESVLRNPDVVRVTITNERNRPFIDRQRELNPGSALLFEQRDINYNGAKVGGLRLEYTAARVERELWADLLKLGAALLAQVIFSFGAIWLLVDKRLLAPLQQLQESARQLARGNLNQPVSLSRDDEIGSLGHHLEDMRVDLSRLISERDQTNTALNVELGERRRAEEELNVLNATLEQRVWERTRELTDAMAQLTTAQTELVRAEKMSALGSLVAGVAHELNTPIGNSLTVASTIQALVDELEQHMTSGLTRGKMERFIDQARTGSNILMRSLGQSASLVASFKQVAADQASEHRRTFNLDECTEELMLVLSANLRTSPHTVRCEIPPGIKMDSYPGPLGQILTNLINNGLLHAFDEMAHGELDIKGTLDGEDWVRLTVQDNGRGISPENQKRVFDPFFTTKLGQGGSGLGLSIVYNLVTSLLGGEISVRSEPGHGTLFTIRLPRVAPVTRQPAAEQTG